MKTIKTWVVAVLFMAVTSPTLAQQGAATGSGGGFTPASNCPSAVGDLLYASSTSLIACLPDVAVGRVLVSGGVGVAPAWSGAPTLTTSLAVGTNPASTGGTILLPNGSSGAIRFRNAANNGDLNGIYMSSGNKLQSDQLFQALNFETQTAVGYFGISSRAIITSAADSSVQLKNYAATVGLDFSWGTPTVSSCGTGAVTAGSTNSAGEFTSTGATSCTINFGTPNFINAPFCTLTEETTAGSFRISAISASSFTVTGYTSGDKFMWHCIGRI